MRRTRTRGEGVYCYFTLKTKKTRPRSRTRSRAKATRQAVYNYTHAGRRTRVGSCGPPHGRGHPCDVPDEPRRPCVGAGRGPHPRVGRCLERMHRGHLPTLRGVRRAPVGRDPEQRPGSRGDSPGGSGCSGRAPLRAPPRPTFSAARLSLQAHQKPSTQGTPLPSSPPHRFHGKTAPSSPPSPSPSLLQGCPPLQHKVKKARGALRGLSSPPPPPCSFQGIKLKRWE